MKTNIFHIGNCVDIMGAMDDDCIDMVVTSPPYDDLRNYEGFSFDSKAVIESLYKVLKPGGVVVWVVGDATVDGSETGTSFRQALQFLDAGFSLHDTMIYEKNTSSFPAQREGFRYTQIFEYMFVFSKGKPKTGNLICDKDNKWKGWTNWGKNTHRDKNGKLVETKDIKPVPDKSPRNNIWRYVVGANYGTKDKKAYKHPATFPEELARDHILTWSNKEDIVLDPFVGSGTTAKMAYLSERKFIGIDISEEYINKIAKPRLQKIADMWLGEIEK